MSEQKFSLIPYIVLSMAFLYMVLVMFLEEVPVISSIYQ